ncbi:trehalose-phosphatase [soil metagenome]
MTVPALADDLLAPLLATPKASGVLTDFDGTLAPIVDEPADARPMEGVCEVLGALAKRFRRVAVISGRPVSFLEPHLPPKVVISGLYGLEVSEQGKHRDHPSAGAWREVVADVASLSEARGPAGMRVEPKHLSITLHYRMHPEIEHEVEAWARRKAGRAGLSCRRAKMSFELHPPIATDKCTAVGELSKGLKALCFIGDDYGDLSAFDAFDRLAREGRTAVKVAVRSAEAPEEILQRADLVVDGPDGALDLLRHLANQAHTA